MIDMDHQIYHFALILREISEINSQLEDRLFEAGCDDGIVCRKHGAVFIEFDRAALSFDQAVIGAIEQLRSAGYEVCRVEPADLVSSAEIAKRAKRSRQSIHQLLTGTRGNGDFPRPISGLSSNSCIWSWAEVSAWLVSEKKVDDPTIAEQAQFLKSLNESLIDRKKGRALIRDLQ